MSACRCSDARKCGYANSKRAVTSGALLALLALLALIAAAAITCAAAPVAPGKAPIRATFLLRGHCHGVLA